MQRHPAKGRRQGLGGAQVELALGKLRQFLGAAVHRTDRRCSRRGASRERRARHRLLFDERAVLVLAVHQAEVGCQLHAGPRAVGAFQFNPVNAGVAGVDDELSAGARRGQGRRVALDVRLPGMEDGDVRPQAVLQPGGLQARFKVAGGLGPEGREAAGARVPAAGLGRSPRLDVGEHVVIDLPVKTEGPGRIVELRVLRLGADARHIGLGKIAGRGHAPGGVVVELGVAAVPGPAQPARGSDTVGQLVVALAEHAGRGVVHIGEILPRQAGIGARRGRIGQEAEVLRAAELLPLLVGIVDAGDIGELVAEAAVDLKFLRPLF